VQAHIYSTALRQQARQTRSKGSHLSRSSLARSPASQSSTPSEDRKPIDRATRSLAQAPICPPRPTEMRPLNARLRVLATLLPLLLCPLVTHAAAAPRAPLPAEPAPAPEDARHSAKQTTLQPPSLATPPALPPSEPLLKLARPTTIPAPPPSPHDAEHELVHNLDLRAAAPAAATQAAPPSAVITPAPAPDGDTSGGEWWHTGVDGNGDTFRYRQTTYYTCVTLGLAEHCGWHRPILEVSGAGELGEASRGVFGTGIGGRAAVVGLLAGGFAYLMGR